ncbi:MAG TPA: hypothetical protein VFF73_29405, partial [Planctomycetota bacterium]|nr:hypothetical protein [Planctomycetota bacterium]
MAEPDKNAPKPLPVAATPPVLSAAGAPNPSAAKAGAPAAKADVSEEGVDRRAVLQLGAVSVPWVGLAWAAFTGSMALATGALGRFLFPN